MTSMQKTQAQLNQKFVFLLLGFKHEEISFHQRRQCGFSLFHIHTFDMKTFPVAERKKSFHFSIFINVMKMIRQGFYARVFHF